MYFTSLTLKNFQAVDSLALADFGPMNIFIGPNGAGKTSILESLYFQFNHASIQDEEAFFSFLNIVHGKHEKYYSIETMVRENGTQYGITTEVETAGKEGNIGDSVRLNGKTVSTAQGEKLVRGFGERIRYITTWENKSKDVYFGGPEPASAQKKRFAAALAALEKYEEPWKDFLTALEDFFPHLLLGDDPKKAITDFFGIGFLGTVKTLLYLHDPRYDVLLIDEPEFHFFPSLGRKFVRLLTSRIAKGYQKQIFIATRSPLFLGQHAIKHFYHVQRDGQQRVRARKRSRDELLRSLVYTGMHPENILSAEMILYVEGPWDIAVFEEFVRKFPELKEVQLSIQQLGGGAVGNMNMDPVRLKENNLFSFVVLDSEKSSKQDQGDASHFRFRDRCYRSHLYCLILERRAIENYFTPRALRSAFGKRVPQNFANRPYKYLEHQIRWYDKEMNRAAARAMTRKEIESFPDLKDLFTNLIKASRQFA